MAKDRTDLNNEAIKINGSYIEDLISGYATLGASGRMNLEREVDSFTVGYADGAKVKGSRFNSRTITVDFLLVGTDNLDLVAKMNTLNAKLSVKDAQIIFNDEADKYYIGTPIFADAPTKGRTYVNGSFSIFCADPFKYSLAETTVNFDTTTKTFTYNGGYKAFPKLQVSFPSTTDSSGVETNTSECGYVGIVDSYEHILQFGDPNEVDWGNVEYPATVPLNQVFKTVTGWSTNSTATINATKYTQTGTITTDSNHTSVSGYGSGSNFHGPSISKTLSDSSSATNFTFNWKSKVVGTSAQFGTQQILLYYNNNGTRTLVGGINFLKNAKDEKCKIYAYVGSTTYKGSAITVGCSKIGECSIVKQDAKVTFNVAGKTFSYSDNNISNLKVNEVAFYFGKNGSKTALGSNFVYNAKLTRTSYTKLEDIPNVFSPGDVLEVDCSDASVRLNGVSAQWLGALGNDWENFVLLPGSNTFAFAYSDWSAMTTPPTLKLIYKERFL